MYAAIYRNRFWISASLTMTLFYISSSFRKEYPFFNMIFLGLGIFSYFFIKSKFRIVLGQIVFSTLSVHPRENEKQTWPSSPKYIPANASSTARREFVCHICQLTFQKGNDYFYHWRKGTSRPRNPTKYCRRCSERVPSINEEAAQKDKEQRLAIELLNQEIRDYYFRNSLGPEKIPLTPDQQVKAAIRSVRIEKFFDVSIKTAFCLYMVVGYIAAFTKIFRSNDHSYSSSSYSRSGNSYSESYSSANDFSTRSKHDSYHPSGNLKKSINPQDEKESAEKDASAELGSPVKISNKKYTYFKVVRVVDGDTVILEDIGKVRLIGIDTPETVHPKKKVEYLGPDASRYMHKLADGQSVRIEYDSNQKDKYGRTLGYLYLKDNRSLNEAMIKEGYSAAYTKYPFAKALEYKLLEDTARKNRVGLWKHTYAYIKPWHECYDKTCSEVTSCAEAYHLFQCGHKELDADGDGVPCEDICR